MLIRASNGDVFETDDAVRFDEQLYWNGFATVGKFSCMASENCRQIMFCASDNYYLTEVTLDNRIRFAKPLSPSNAATWLLSNSHPLPANLPKPRLVGQGLDHDASPQH